MTDPVPPRARERAAAWLALVDARDARTSWEETGAAFRAAVPTESWAQQLAAARDPLGPLTSRTLAVEERVTDPPTAPPGEYVVQQYHSVYDRRKAVVETLTLQHEPDGEWRVVGYFIR